MMNLKTNLTLSDLDEYVIQQVVCSTSIQLAKEGKPPVDIAQGVFDAFKKISSLLASE